MASTHEELVAKLRTIREELARNPWRERREALRRCLDYELGRLPRPRIRQVLAAVKSDLRDGEGGSQNAAADLRTAVHGLQHESERLRAERDRLKQELELARQSDATIQRLRDENDRLQKRLAEPGGAAGGSHSTLREAIIQLINAKKQSAEDLGLTGEDAKLFESLAQLIIFAQDNDRSVNMLMLEISGRIEKEGTIIRDLARQQFRKLFLKCLDGGAEERKRLREHLQQSIKFQLLMSHAYMSSYHPGVKKLLEGLDPQPMLDSNTGLMGFGHDYAKAFKAYQREYGDMAAKRTDQLRDEYFLPHVRKQLSDYLDQLSDG